MHLASPRKRRPRALKRFASATALAVGAAVLTTPGAAAAQGVDCTALGANPIAEGLVAALETAMACGVEVRVAQKSGPYETAYATPDAGLHVVQTVDPVQEYGSLGPVDTTLVENEGSLRQANASVAFSFSGADTTAPLMLTQAGSLDWNGDQPVPTVAGSTDVYEGLTDGLDLTVEAGVSYADLEFTIGSAEAWQALATGLTFTGEDGLRRSSGTLYAPHVDQNGRIASWEQSSALIVRDANGKPYTAAPTVAGSAITLTLDQSMLDTAAYPLTLSTQWTHRIFGVAEWGAATSAAPQLTAFRGDAGLDQPYFEAAGQGADAVTGPYCDALIDPECASPAEAMTYWNFWRDFHTTLRPSNASSLTFTKTAATFSVDAADPAACAAPDLLHTSVYRPSTTWDNRPTALGHPAVDGRCESGTAIYDLDQVHGATDTAITLAMAESAETARFDGGSARLDIYYDLYATPSITGTGTTTCGTAAAPNYQTTASVTYGKFTASLWRPDLIDPGLTWTAEVVDTGTGATVFATDPAKVANGVNPTATTSLADGSYRLIHEFASSTGPYSRTSTCHLVIDTTTPEIVDIEVSDGPHYKGDTVTVKVSVADDGFPDGVNELTVACWSNSQFACSPRAATLKEGTTVSFTQRLSEDSNDFSIRLQDKAGNFAAIEKFSVVTVEPSSDYNVDGYQDLITVRRSDGQLLFYAGNGNGTFDSPVARGAGWGGLEVVMAGDLTSDRFPDLLARDARTGILYTYPGKGDGTFGPRLQTGSGWNSMGMFTSATDFNEDGRTDLLAVRKSDKQLYLYPGKGDGTFGSRSIIPDMWSGAWEGWDNLTTIGDVNWDGIADVVARYGIFAEPYVFYSDGEGSWEQRRGLGISLGVYDDDGSRYFQMTGGGDYNEDDWKDLLAVDSRTGELVLRSWDQNFFEVTADKTVGTGWSAVRLPVAAVDRTFDHDRDSDSDVFVRSSGGTNYLYRGNGSGGFQGRWEMFGDFKSMTLLESAGDFNGDGMPDMFARTSGGDLYLYHQDNTGSSTLDQRIKVGTGWNSLNMITGGYDYNGDGRADILARETSTGTLWLYPGTGAGKVGARVKVASGWGAFRETEAVGDFDHDGKADFIAIKTADECVYLYRGNGNGTFKTAYKLGCGWENRSALTAVGDFDGDGRIDWLARRKSDGAMFLYSGNGSNGYTGKQIATGWSVFNQIA